jgi:uncharacterized protein YqhQ
MEKAFKKHSELILIILSIIFIASIIFFFVKIVNFLIPVFEKSLSTPKIPQSSVEFNVNDAIFILKKHQLIQ